MTEKIKKINKTYHAEKQSAKRKIPDDEIEEVIRSGTTRRITIDGAKKIELNNLVVVLATNGKIITAYYKRKKPNAKSSKQHIRSRKVIKEAKDIYD